MERLACPALGRADARARPRPVALAADAGGPPRRHARRLDRSRPRATPRPKTDHDRDPLGRPVRPGRVARSGWSPGSIADGGGRPMTRSDRRRGGYALIELLVVITAPRGHARRSPPGLIHQMLKLDRAERGRRRRGRPTSTGSARDLRADAHAATGPADRRPAGSSCRSDGGRIGRIRASARATSSGPSGEASKVEHHETYRRPARRVGPVRGRRATGRAPVVALVARSDRPTRPDADPSLPRLPDRGRARQRTAAWAGRCRDDRRDPIERPVGAGLVAVVRRDRPVHPRSCSAGAAPGGLAPPRRPRDRPSGGSRPTGSPSRPSTAPRPGWPPTPDYAGETWDVPAERPRRPGRRLGPDRGRARPRPSRPPRSSASAPTIRAAEARRARQSARSRSSSRRPRPPNAREIAADEPPAVRGRRPRASP